MANEVEGLRNALQAAKPGRVDVTSVAYHEAAHFVASYILTPSSCRGTVTIRPDKEAGKSETCSRPKSSSISRGARPLRKTLQLIAEVGRRAITRTGPRRRPPPNDGGGRLQDTLLGFVSHPTRQSPPAPGQ